MKLSSGQALITDQTGNIFFSKLLYEVFFQAFEIPKETLKWFWDFDFLGYSKTDVHKVLHPLNCRGECTQLRLKWILQTYNAQSYRKSVSISHCRNPHDERAWVPRQNWRPALALGHPYPSPSLN